MGDKVIHKIRLFNEQRDIDCLRGGTILEAALAAKIDHTHACGGQGKCSTCRVSVMEGIDNCTPRSEAEKEIADKLNFPAEIRLACQTTVCGDVSIRRMVSDKMDMDLIYEEFSDDSSIAL